jgi:hypothetical protein
VSRLSPSRHALGVKRGGTSRGSSVGTYNNRASLCLGILPGRVLHKLRRDGQAGSRVVAWRKLTREENRRLMILQLIRPRPKVM